LSSRFPFLVSLLTFLFPNDEPRLFPISFNLLLSALLEAPTQIVILFFPPFPPPIPSRLRDAFFMPSPNTLEFSPLTEISFFCRAVFSFSRPYSSYPFLLNRLLDPCLDFSFPSSTCFASPRPLFRIRDPFFLFFPPVFWYFLPFFFFYSFLFPAVKFSP